MCWLAQGEVFGFALGEFALCYTDLILAISGTMALTSSGQ